MAKCFVWILTIIGLAPSVMIAIASLVILINFRQAGLPRRGVPSNLSREAVYLHDSYVGLSGWTLSIAPQYWPIVLVFTGVGLILIGVYAILR